MRFQGAEGAHFVDDASADYFLYSRWLAGEPQILRYAQNDIGSGGRWFAQTSGWVAGLRGRAMIMDTHAVALVLAMQIRDAVLDEQEYAEIASLFRVGMRSVKDYRNETGAPLREVPLTEHFAPLLTRYEAMTGYTETDPNAVMHHRLSLWSSVLELRQANAHTEGENLRKLYGPKELIAELGGSPRDANRRFFATLRMTSGWVAG